MNCKRCPATATAVNKRTLIMSKKDDYFATLDSQIKTWDTEVDMLTEPAIGD